MKSRKQNTPKKWTIIILAVVISAVLYLAGVYSGLYANKILEKKTEQEITSIKEGTEQQMQRLEEYIGFLESNQGSMWLELSFLETLSEDEICNFSEISLKSLFEQLDYYWKRLPFRIEEYERDNQPLSEEYLALKKEYTQLSMRTWILARKRYNKCDTKIVHGLNFYTTDCELCAKQGEEIDKFSSELREKGVDALIFTIDLNSEEPIVKFLKQYYSIQSTPALLINSRIYQGQVFKADYLLGEVEKGR